MLGESIRFRQGVWRFLSALCWALLHHVKTRLYQDGKDEENKPRETLQGKRRQTSIQEKPSQSSSPSGACKRGSAVDSVTSP